MPTNLTILPRALRVPICIRNSNAGRNTRGDRWTSLLAIAATATLLTACGPTTQVRDAAPVGYPDTTARVLLSDARYEEAAQEYVRLAGLAGGSDSIEFRLAAADALRRGGDLSGTEAMLASVNPQSASNTQNARVTLIRARIALDSDDSPRALALTNSLDLNQLPSEFATEASQIRADVFAASGDYVASARERVGLELALTDPSDINLNRRALWHGLEKTSASALSGAATGQAPDTLAGWIELALLSKRYLGSSAEFNGQLQGWSGRYPGHPANDTIVGELIADAEQLSAGFRHVGLVLPFSGPFGEAAEAIRDGFTAAWFLDGNPSRPEVSVFDSTGQDPQAVVAQAVSAGVDVIVGPLRKDSVGRLESWPERPLPILALNSSAGTTLQAIELQDNPNAPTGKPLIQFALSPEGEAARVAERAWGDGLVQVGVLTPDSEWGERVAAAFSEAWLALGGVIVDSQAYSREVHEMAEPVKALLQISASEQRKRRLQAVLKTEIEHEPRRRDDLDFIFLAAFPQTARSLKPQIDFFRGSDLPIYSTSHIYTGFADPGADQDIERVIFGDMPWVLEDSDRARALRDQISSAWPQSSSGFTRFYAFGADAYDLIPNLRRLATNPDEEISGYTGWLSVQAGETIKRRLSWAQIRKGYPELIDAIR